jgi:hypothetical protein
VRATDRRKQIRYRIEGEINEIWPDRTTPARRSIVLLAAALLVLSFAVASPAAAQAVYGSVAGFVTDATGAAAPGVTVMFTSAERRP